MRRNNDPDSQSEWDTKAHREQEIPVDIHNYKGICEDEDESKYIDPENGSHFEFYDFCNRLVQINRMPEDEKYHRENDSHFYSSDSQTQTTASCLFAGSVIVTTPTDKSESLWESPEVVFAKIENSKMKKYKIDNLETVNPRISSEEHSSKRNSTIPIPKILFGNHRLEMPNKLDTIKRINKVTQKVTLNI